MNRAILFRFYKEVDICSNRLQIIRYFNPSIKIFGLYGGNTRNATKFKQTLSPFLDDFYHFSKNKDKKWKWRHVYLMINQWFLDRGYRLKWDSLVDVQWDMLVFGSVDKLFSNVKGHQFAMSGLRPVKEVKHWWHWVKDSNQKEKAEYEKFLEIIEANTERKPKPYCGQFVIVILPRTFLERYSKIPETEIGFHEYKVPTYAKAWDIEFADCRDFEPWWPGAPKSNKVPELNRTLIGGKYPISYNIIRKHLCKKNGQRIFHPYYEMFPIWKVKLFRLLDLFFTSSLLNKI